MKRDARYAYVYFVALGRLPQRTVEYAYGRRALPRGMPPPADWSAPIDRLARRASYPRASPASQDSGVGEAPAKENA
jgi:hypothetical protein